MIIYCLCKLADATCEWREVEAATISGGMEAAAKMPDVVAVLEGSVNPGGVLT